MKKDQKIDGVPITQWGSETWEALNAAIQSGAAVHISVPSDKLLPEQDFRGYFQMMADGTSAPEENKFFLTGNILRR